MLPMLTVLPGVTLVLVGGPILTPSSNPALRGVNLEVVGGTTLARNTLQIDTLYTMILQTLMDELHLQLGYVKP